MCGGLSGWRVFGGSWPTSSLAEMLEAGVLGRELVEVVVPMPELGESPSPATSWISLARMARSLARSWLSLKWKQIKGLDVDLTDVCLYQRYYHR